MVRERGVVRMCPVMMWISMLMVLLLKVMRMMTIVRMGIEILRLRGVVHICWLIASICRLGIAIIVMLAFSVHAMNHLTRPRHFPLLAHIFAFV